MMLMYLISVPYLNLIRCFGLGANIVQIYRYIQTDMHIYVCIHMPINRRKTQVSSEHIIILG